MATVRDSDISLWLHNKLGTSNDSWTSGSICSQLNSEVLRNIKDCFPDLQTQVKLKLLLSFFHIPRRNVDEWRVELEEIVEVAQVDSEIWVSMLAEMMKTLPATGTLNTVITDNEQNKKIFSDLVTDLKKLVRKQSETGMLPLECHYLNKSALHNIVGQQPAPVKHFTLKRKPKSAALRAELLQKSVDAASNLKKSAAPTVPVRSRAMPRKMTDTTPLKGIPSRVPTGGFQSGLSNNSLISRLSLPRNPGPRKDGGIKLLDINEQPIAYAQAKKRKRMQELEESNKKVSESPTTASTATSTPDYALGLVPPPSVAPATPLQPLETAPIPSYVPPSATSNLTVVTTVLQPPAFTSVLNPPTPSPISTTVQTETTMPVEIEVPVHKPTVITSVPKPAEGKGRLLVPKDLVEKVKEIFTTANKVSRPEKALILSFIGGSRENPCVDMSDIVTIKLSEYEESVIEDSRTVIKMAETYFQMNYNNGEWKTLKKYRNINNESQTLRDL